MEQKHSIVHLTNPEIDRVKWDTCISNAPNGLVYAYSVYLDQMSRHWDGLVLGDYEAVMPLTWNRKYGVAYLYQPFLCAQLGIFGSAIDAIMMEQFLYAIPSKFRYWDIYLNHQNLHPIRNIHFYERSNFILHLDQPYQQLYNSYRENIQRNIKKAFQLGCTTVKGFGVEQVITLARSQMRDGGQETEENLLRFAKLYSLLEQQGQARTYGILSSKKELIASCVFVFSHNRAYYILVGNHPDGRTIGASHALIDSFIKDYAGQQMILDFEGSDIRNVAFFYSSFGAREEKYLGVKANKLPFYLKWLKDQGQP
ncbi:MAG: GNAT family N-acetyltransferase [Chitinophagaceae bacterium]|nr:MAG: GNAT family N-acetyltransferase [Chitinophagaceae bacterium]